MSSIECNAQYQQFKDIALDGQSLAGKLKWKKEKKKIKKTINGQQKNVEINFAIDNKEIL